jgi:hypothetical protein
MIMGAAAVPAAIIFAPLRILRESGPDSPLIVVPASTVNVGVAVSSPMLTGPLRTCVASLAMVKLSV